MNAHTHTHTLVQEDKNDISQKENEVSKKFLVLLGRWKKLAKSSVRDRKQIHSSYDTGAQQTHGEETEI